MRYAIAIVAALALAILAAGCATGGPGSARTAAAPPIDVTTTSITSFSSVNEFMQPTAGHRFLKVDFTITNTGAGAFAFNPVRTSLGIPDGHAYMYDPVSYTVPGAFRQQTIAPGQTAAGVLVFAVPVGLPKDTAYTLRVW